MFRSTEILNIARRARRTAMREKQWASMAITPEEIDALNSITLPALPKIIRYTDVNFGPSHVIANPNQNDVWTITANRKNLSGDFGEVPIYLRKLFKSYVAEALLVNRYSSATALSRLTSVLIPAGQNILIKLLLCPPEKIVSLWNAIDLVGEGILTVRLSFFKSILSYACRAHALHWGPDLVNLISRGLHVGRTERQTKHHEDLLTLDEETVVIRFLDDLARRANNASVDELMDGTLLMTCYQHGFRPIQMEMLKWLDYKQFETVDGTFDVHCRFCKVKQRSGSSKKLLPINRSYKPDWAPIFVEFARKNRTANPGEKDYVWPVPYLDARISVASAHLGLKRLSAYNFRHSFAQRLADAGCTAEEIAEALGHSNTQTARRYVENSPCQAKLVNEALGISPIYKTLVKMHRDGFISEQELRRAREDQQVAGTPHGILLAGIGLCKAGQPNCPYNPVTSCYGCHKFLASTDLGIHMAALEGFRDVVKQFEEVSRGEQKSPAFSQLKTTCANIVVVIEQLNKMKGVIND
jgi:integrase